MGPSSWSITAKIESKEACSTNSYVVQSPQFLRLVSFDYDDENDETHIGTAGIASFTFSNLHAKKREIPFIYLNQNQILYITVIDNIYHDDGFGSGNFADRYYDIEETLVKVLRETEFPMGYKIVRFGARVPENQPELQLYITKWGAMDWARSKFA